MINKLVLLPIVAAITLSGCTQMGSTSFRNMSSAYRDVLETYANDNVLLNIVRSSKQMPVSFLDMPSVVGTGSVQAQAGVAGFISSSAPSSVAGFFSATAGSSVGPSVGLSVNNSFNFTQSSLDNAQFMSAFLSDIRPDVIASLTNNQVGPRSILYSLVIDTIEIRNSKNVIISKFFNNPYLPKYNDFQDALYMLIEAGLSTEIVPTKQILSAPMNAEALNRNLLATVTAQNVPGVMVEPIKVGGVTHYQLVRVVPTTRMCLNQTAEFELVGKHFAESAYCNVQTTGTLTQPLMEGMGQKLTDRGVDKDSLLVVKLRSTRNVFDFLGSLLTLQNSEPKTLIKVLNSDEISRNPKLLEDESMATALPLFVVQKGNNITGQALTSVTYQGETYAVPADSNSYTRQVLSMVSQLLTLNKVPGAIPASPAVLIK